MQFQAIESFLMVYETQNMTRASERLFVTQQCISRQIKGLEQELGKQLFIRKKTGMVPTAVCHRLFPEFQKMLGCFENARNICGDDENKLAPKLTIAMAIGMSNYIDFSFLSLLVRNYTGHELLIKEVSSADCSKMLHSGECDMSFLLEPFDDTMIEHSLVFWDCGYIAMQKNHPLAKQSGPISLSALDGIKLITGVSSNCATEHFWRYCNQTNVHPHCVASVANITGCINNLKKDDVVVTILSHAIELISNPDIVFRKVV